MSKSIVNLITSEKAAQAVSVVEKTLAKKLRDAISSQRSIVAKNTYGSLGECYGADETPEFMEPGDNAYQAFYQNALKKFGVTGPQDFKDENTKQQFFNYLDMNWKAQDAVKQQQVPGAASTGGMDLGTQTQLPAPAMQPRAPQAPGTPPQVCPDPQAHMPPGGAQDPSLTGMSQSGMGANTADPLGADGDEGDLDDMQQGQGQYGSQDGNDEGSVWGGADGQFGNGPDFDPDPDLEIGDEGEQEDQDDEFGPGYDRDDEDEQGLNLSGDNEGEGDEDVPQDDEFADDDAYNVDHKDFGRGDEDSDDDDDQGDDSDDDSDRFGRNHSNDDDDEDSDDDDDDDSDPDLEIGDEDDSDDNDEDEKPSPFPSKKSKEAPKKKKAFGESLKPSDRSRKTRKADFAKATRATGKKETRVHEGEDGEVDDGVTFGENFNFDADNAEDQAYLNEQSMLAQVDPSVAPKLRSARRELNKVKQSRDATSAQIKKHLQLAKTPKERKALAKVHAQNRVHFRTVANTIKGIHTKNG